MVCASISICGQISPDDYQTDRFSMVFDPKDKTIEDVLNWAKSYGPGRTWTINDIQFSTVQNEGWSNNE